MGDRCRCCRRSYRGPSSRAIGTLTHPRSRHTQTDLGCSLPPPSTLPSAPDISLLYDDRRDVVVVVGPEERRFPAHASVLRTSPVLANLLLQVQRVGDGSAVAELRLSNIRPDVFDKFLGFLYSKEVRLECVTSALDLVHVADEYLVPELFTRCLDYLLTHVDLDNVLEVFFRLSHVTGKVEPQENQVNEVKDRCRDLIDLHAERLLASAQFCGLPQSLVADLVARSSLRVESEMSVANALDRWATQACLQRGLDPTPEHKREMLGQTAIQVRFFQLNKEKFLQDSVAQSLLEPRDVTLVLNYMKNRLKAEQLPPHLRDNLGLCKRRLAAVKDPVQGVSTPGNNLKAAAPRQRKTVCQRFKKGIGNVAWAVIAFLD
ncbi:unnamed protein product [Ixodes hexagonus]